MALLTRIGLAGVGQRSLYTDTLRTTKFWRVPSNAPISTAARMIVFNSGSPANTVAQEGAVTADQSGNFDLSTTDGAAAGSKRLAVVHDWGGNTGTASMKGGPAIATMNEAPL